MEHLRILFFYLLMCVSCYAYSQEENDTIIKHDPAEYLSNTLPVLYLLVELE